MGKTYIVNFGDSDTYRVASMEVAKKIAERLDETLRQKFAESYNGALLTVDVRKIDASVAAQYPEITEDNYTQVLPVLESEMKVRSEVHMLNDNAPFANA